MSMQVQTNLEALRNEGREAFVGLTQKFPLPFHRRTGSLNTLRSLPRMLGLLPKANHAPWQIDEVVEKGNNTLELGYKADASLVEYYLGFLEAMVDYFGECAFILAQTLGKEVRIRMVFAQAA